MNPGPATSTRVDEVRSRQMIDQLLGEVPRIALPCPHCHVRGPVAVLPALGSLELDVLICGRAALAGPCQRTANELRQVVGDHPAKGSCS